MDLRHHHHTDDHPLPRFNKGDIVWAKSSSSRWSPALILNTRLNPSDPIPIFSLSFFDNKFPRYRFETDLRPFEQHFPHLIKHLTCTTSTTTTTSIPLLDLALKYLAEREELGLRCRCLVNSGEEKGRFGKEEKEKKGVVLGFGMEEVLGFMRGVAVEGFIEEVELVGAVKMAARVRVVRKFFEIREREFWREVRRKRRIRESRMAGRQSKLSDYGQQETEWQDLSEQTAACYMNDAAVANDLTFSGKIVQESIPVDQISKGGRILVEHNETLSFPLMLKNLHCLALDMFYLPSECLDSFMVHFLRLRTWTCQDSRNYWKYRCCSYENVEAPFSSDERFGIQLLDHTDQQSHSQEIVNTIAPSMKSNPCLETKEQLLPTLGSPIVLKPMPSIFSIIRDAIVFQRSQLTTEAESPFLHKSCRSIAFGITQIPDAIHAADIDLDKEILVSKAPECQDDVSIPQDQWSCTSYNQHCAEEMASSVAVAGLKGPRMVNLMPQARTVLQNVHNSNLYKGCKITDCCEVEEMSTLPAGTPYTTTSDIIYEVYQSLSTEYNESKKFHQEFHQDIHPDASAMSQATHQLEACQSRLFPTSLHIKFPRGCNLPSRKELIKRFSRFGPINTPWTKVFSNPSAAQVVFLHKVDAVAAYHYAKRKKVLSSLENVRFWLDSNANVRKGSNPSLINSQKSCLKRSRHLGQESKGPPKKVEPYGCTCLLGGILICLARPYAY